MILSELGFREYYHQYVILEADALTEKLKDKLPITERDCFMLVSSFIADSGELAFNVLAAGPSLKTCTKGLKLSDMLHVFRPEQVGDLRCCRVNADSTMIRKNVPWIEKAESTAPDALRLTRKESRIDHLRDDFFPDVVQVGILCGANENIHEYAMRIENIEGPFLVGRLLERTSDDAYYIGELLRTMPYQLGDSIRLLTVFAGDVLSDEDEKSKKKLCREAEQIGYGFCDPTWQS